MIETLLPHLADALQPYWTDFTAAGGGMFGDYLAKHEDEVCEALLATLRFAVARVDSVDKAVQVISTLLPDVIVARGRDVSALQRAAWPSGVPFVIVTDDISEPAALIDAIRSAIRSARPVSN